MKKWLVRSLWGVAVLVAVALLLWYWFFGYTCSSFAPEFHERWGAESREEWRHLDNLLRHDAEAAAALLRETGMVGRDAGVAELAVNISAMLDLVQFAAEKGELKTDADFSECRVRKARLSDLLVVGGYLRIVEDLYGGGNISALYRVPECSYLLQPEISLLAHLIHGPALARLREDSPLTPLQERWELVKKLLSRCDDLPPDAVKALGSLSVEENNPEFALYAAQNYDLSRTQKIFMMQCGLMMDNGLPLVRCMMEAGCPTEYHFKSGQEKAGL